ncbi:MAG: hypothetical protein IJO43_00335 [Bacilli bacterium]|nr:hypothetical protein [Bacilli bacterium]
MPTIDLPAIGGILADLALSILTYAGIAAILYSIGGILIRTVSWTFDTLLVSFIGKFYSYFETIINGTLLTDKAVSDMMNRVYLLVGVFVVFRLGVLLISYIINPSEVMDEKVGVSALVKRIIIGLILIIFMPTIFKYAFRLQDAILDDQVIERVIMSDDEMKKADEYKKKHGMGKIIGMTVFQGFFSLSESAKSNGSVKKNYEKATDIDKTYDLTVINSLGSGLNSGILHEVGDEYAHDYFPIFSCAVLIYVLYMLVQYCLDAVVRSLKLSVLQVIAPICIVEYMINNDRNEVFKSWRKAVISTFAMLLMRVASIWFVAYVTMLMQPGMIDSSSLLQTSDNLLKAIIVLGLLAFMMDFPKMMSDIFGLDLDQSGSVKGVLGKAMGVATAGLAIGGAAAGFGLKAAGGLKNTAKGGISALANKSADKFKNFADANAKRAATAKANGMSRFGNRLQDLSDKQAKKADRRASFAAGLNNPGKTALAQAGALGAFGIAGANALSQTAREGGSVRANYKMNRSALDRAVQKAGSGKVGKTMAELGVEFVASAKASNLGTILKSGGLAMGAAVLASNAVTKSAQSGYQQTSGAVDSKVSGKEQKEREQAYREKTISVMENIDVTTQASYGQQTAANHKLDSIVDNTEVTATQTVNIDQKIGKISGDVSSISDTTNTISQNVNTVVEQNATISHTLNQIEDNTFHTDVESVENNDTIGGVAVSEPDSNTGERTTKSGLIIPGSIDVDNY